MPPRRFAVSNEGTEFEGVVRSEKRGDRIARDRIFHHMTGISSLTARLGSARYASGGETGRRHASPSDPGGYAKREERI